MFRRHLFVGLLAITAISESSCSLFFGNIKPVEEKSSSYGIADLSKTDPNWVRLDPKATVNTDHADEQETPESGISDMVLQSEKTASIISISSACKTYGKMDKTQSLQELTRELFLGISDITLQDEKRITVANTPALQTTIKGNLKGEGMELRTVVLQHNSCVYDLMYIARPDKFSENEADFSHFVSSLGLR